MNNIGADSADAQDLAQEGRQGQKLMNDSVILAATTVATAGVGTVFAGAVEAGTLTTGTAYALEIGTGAVAGSGISVVGRSSNSSDWKTNAEAGAFEGATLSLGSVGGKFMGQLSNINKVESLAKVAKAGG